MKQAAAKNAVATPAPATAHASAARTRPADTSGLAALPPARPLWQALALGMRSQPAANTVGDPDGPGPGQRERAATGPDPIARIGPHARARPPMPHRTGGGNAPIQRKCAACEDEEQVQRKGVAVSRSDDPAEREADRLAEAFIAGVPGPHPATLAGAGAVRRQATATAPAQAASADGGATAAALGRLDGQAGTPMAPAARRPYEQFFGADLSPVRLHTGAADADAARHLHAEAFTRGHDVYFAAGRFDERSVAGRRLLAHELAHVAGTATARGSAGTATAPGSAGTATAQGSAGTATPRGHAAPAHTAAQADGIQRSGLGDAVSGFIDDPVGTASRAADAVINDPLGTASRAAGAVVDSAADGLGWLAGQAGELALSQANALASLWGGSVRIIGACLVIDIPTIPLFPDTEKTLVESPPVGFFVPLLGPAGTMLGPIPVVGMAGLLAYVQASIEGVVGPAQVRGIQVRICPFGTSVASAEVYAAAAVGLRIRGFGGVFGALGTAIPFDPPIPVVLIAQGGLLATGTGWLIGGARSTAALSYAGGTLSLANTLRLAVGGLLTGDLDFFAALRLYDKIVCQYQHPLHHWEGGRAWQLTIPMAASLSRSGFTGSIGPLSHGPMPIQDLEIAIHPLPEGWSCLDWDEIERFLCENGYLPPALCPTEDGEPATHAAGSCSANDNLGESADSFISRCRKASIRSEFPGEMLQQSLGDIKRGKSARHKKAWKLLNDNRFKKPGTSVVPGTGPGTGPGATPAAKSNRIRVQLQHKSDDVVPAEVVQEDRAITVAEGHGAVDRVDGKAGKSVRKACKSAFSSMKKTISGYPPSGVDASGNVARKWCDDHPSFERGIRLDLENLAGKNFTS